MTNEGELDEKTIQLLKSGEGLLGMASSATGSALSFLGGVAFGPAGSMAGSMAGAGIAHVGKTLLHDFAQRDLSQRERRKVGLAASLAIYNLQRDLQDGEKLREDSFFKPSGQTGTSPADEVLEGVLQSSKNEHEIKKLLVLANIFSRTVVNEEISLGEANYAIQIARSLTYRGMCVLALFGGPNPRRGLHQGDYEPTSEGGTYVGPPPTPELASLLQEILTLCNDNLVTIAVNGSLAEGEVAVRRWLHIEPDNLYLVALGKRLYEILDLKAIPPEDVAEVRNLLSL